MDNQNPKLDFRRVNPTLGKQPNVGPFPADQLIPWVVICGLSYYLCKQIFGLSWVVTGMAAAWGISTWWVLTGSRAWRFLSKFVPTPTWTRGFARYERLLNGAEQSNFLSTARNVSKKRKK